MKMKNLSLLVMVFFFLMLIHGCNCHSSEIDILEKELFLFNTYSNLKPPPEQKGHCVEEDLNIISCDAYYVDDYISNVTTVTIRVYPVSSAAINDELVIKAISHNYNGLPSDNMATGNIDSIKYYFPGTNKIQLIYWISGKHLVSIGRRKKPSDNNSVPSKMIDDYMIKFPPTATFQQSDFNTQDVLRRCLLRNFDHIRELEKQRGPYSETGKKSDEYLAMIIQCRFEARVRGKLGQCDEQKHVDCPATLTLNDDDRNKQWQELEETAKTNQIVLDNVDWTNPEESVCHYNSNDKAVEIILLLGMTKEDLNQIPKSFQPVMRPEDIMKLKDK